MLYPALYGDVVQPQVYENPVSKIELSVSCRNLLDLDVFSKSDPFVVLLTKSDNDNWREFERTEIIWNNLNPEFAKSFVLDYFFEEQQILKFEVYDADCESADLSQHDFIGRLVTSLGSIVGEHGGTIEEELQVRSKNDHERNENYTKKSPGSIIVRSEEVANNKDVLTLHLSGKNLAKMDFFGKSDPFLTLEKCNEDGSYSVQHRTEPIMKNLNPQWGEFSIPVSVLCNGDMQRTIRVSCLDWNRSGSHDLIGSFDTCARDLVNYRKGRPSSYELVHPKKKEKKGKYKNSGTINILNCVLTQKASFLDYIRGGLEMNFVVAIDFTASNGDPQQSDSLHYNSPHKPSQYVQALQAVGSIIEDYDTDKLFPAFGFGAKMPPTNQVSHEFALNFNPRNPNCQGIGGIVTAYYNSIQNVTLSGPTNFSPVIYSTIRIAKESFRQKGGKEYFVLLIITDGIISDMEQTKEAIVEAATLPISIIIVGVGSADFNAMEELDGDVVRVSYRGKEAERDIVQFVAFGDYTQHGNYSPTSGVRLAKDVLHELPDQLTEFMEKRNLRPSIR